MKRFAIIIMALVVTVSSPGILHATPVPGTSSCAVALWQGTSGDSGGTFVPSVAYLDWVSTGDAIAAGLAPTVPGGRPNAVVGQTFTLRIQSRLDTINSTTKGTIIPFTGLNSSFEYTIIASIPCEIVSVRNLSATKTFIGFRTTTDGTTPGQIYLLNSPGNAQSTGAGFDDGDIVMQLSVATGQNISIAYDSSTGIVGTLNLVGTVSSTNTINPTFVYPVDFIQSVTTDNAVSTPTSSPSVYFASGTIFPTFTPGSGDLNLKLDAVSSFSCRCSGKIGDVVWNDQNGNGIQDSGEPGIDGVRVTLKTADGIPIAVHTTGQNLNQHGYYQFGGLCAGTYTVEVDSTTLPSSYTPTRSFETADPSLDSNGSPATVVLASDTGSDQTVDFGYVPPDTCQGVIGNVVWHDTNHDGLQDEESSEGLDNVTLRLFDNKTGLQLATALTGPASGIPHGSYAFTNLCAGEYKVVVDTTALPAGFTPTLSPDGADTAADGNSSPAIITLDTNTTTDQTVDFGFVSPCTAIIGDRVWHDMNRNGLQDEGEPGIDGLTVRLYHQGSATPVATTTTNQQGMYQFSGLCAGDYTVAVDESTLPAGFTPTETAVGSDPAIDSASSPASVTLADDAATELGIDFGYLSPCTGVVGDFIWEDLNGNGIQDSGEPGISTVIVTLKDMASNSVLKTATTDTNGIYQFTGVCSGSYKVEVTPPSGFRLTQTSSSGSIPESDSNPNPATVTLTSDAASDLSIDFGMYRPVAIGDLVWTDLNGDGIQNNSEPGMAGVSVELYQATATTPIATTVTDQYGLYLFENLAPGAYQVKFILPAGYFFTQPFVGSSLFDSNADPATGMSDAVSLTSGQQADLSIDAGIYQLASIGDRVWNDLNGNGSQDAGESGINGWMVTLRLSGTIIATTSTAGDGAYTFSNLAPGTYRVCTAPLSGYIQTFDADGLATPDCATLTIAAGEIRKDIDFGYLKSQSSIMIIKRTNGVDAPTGTGPLVPLGSTVSWMYLVTNTGNVPLTEVVVSDNMGVAVSCPQTTLDPGATMICTGSGTATAGQYTNIGSVSGKDPLGTTVKSQYTSHYFGAAPAISIVKKTNGVDAPTGTGPTVSVGSTVTWTYLVTNTGNVTLSGVVVTDSKGVAVTCPQTTLAAGAAMTCSGTGTAIEGQYENIGYVTGADSSSTVVKSQYASHYYGKATCGGAVTTGDTATIGFWHNKNGQALIKALNGGGCSTKLANWLASNFPSLFGAKAGCNNLTGKKNTDVAALFQKFFAVCGTKVDAQILAAALACYVTNPDLAGTVARSYGFSVTCAGTGGKTYNVGSYGCAIGLKSNTAYTVMQLLLQANQKKQCGSSFNAGAFNSIFDGINIRGDIK